VVILVAIRTLPMVWAVRMRMGVRMGVGSRRRLFPRPVGMLVPAVRVAVRMAQGKQPNLHNSEPHMHVIDSAPQLDRQRMNPTWTPARLVSL
jgi:hypothetical protein